MEKVLLIGGSGLIGQILKDGLREYSVDTFRARSLNDSDREQLIKIFADYQVIINLAGKNINCQWTKKNKFKIIQSRVSTTHTIVSALNQLEGNGKLFINASAIGLYQENHRNTETDYIEGGGFLSEVVKLWEAEADKLNYNKARLVKLRLGVVIDQRGGFLRLMNRLVSLNMGSYFGDGSNLMPAICGDELVSILRFLVNSELSGPVNILQPKTITVQEIMHAIKQSSRSALIIWRVPVFILKLIVGKRSEIILNSIQVEPEALNNAGYQFLHEDIKDCLKRTKS